MSGAESDAARFFQALGDPTRLTLLRVLRAGERNVTELVEALGCPQPKVSRHLKVLKDAGLVADQRAGRHVTYALTVSRRWPEPARRWLERLEAGLSLRAAPVSAAPVSAARPEGVPKEPGRPPVAAAAAPSAPSASPRRPTRGLEAHLL